MDALRGDAEQQRGARVVVAGRFGLREELASGGDPLLFLSGVSLDEGEPGGDEGEDQQRRQDGGGTPVNPLEPWRLRL